MDIDGDASSTYSFDMGSIAESDRSVPASLASHPRQIDDVDIAKTIYLKQMKVGAEDRIPFQRAHLWNSFKTTINRRYHPSADGPPLCYGDERPTGLELVPDDEGLTSEHREVGVIVGEEPSRWLPTGKAGRPSKGEKAGKQSQDILDRDAHAMRVQVPVTTDQATQAKLYVACR